MCAVLSALGTLFRLRRLVLHPPLLVYLIASNESIFAMKNNILIAAASSILLVSVSGSAQTQSQPRQGDIFGQLLGAVFGTNQQASEQVLETDWNQGRRPFEQRRPGLEARIDTAVRQGSLTRNDADQIRREYNDIVRLEAQYSVDGNVSQQQRSDLRARYRALSQRVGGGGPGVNAGQGYDQDNYRDDEQWQPLESHYRDFERQVDTGLRNRQLTQSEAAQLRSDWRNLAQTEANYQRGGIDNREQADLWARYNNIEERLNGRADGGFGNDRDSLQWSQLETRLTTAERNGSISRNEGVQLRVQLGDLARLDQAYAAGGYTADEREYLTQRYRQVDAMLGFDRR